VAHWGVLEKSDLLSQLRIDRGADRPPRRRIRLYVVLASAAVLLGGGLWLGVLRAQPPVVQTVVARAAGQGAGAGSVLDASGYVTARRQATVSAKITGKVTEVLIEEGQRVREGAVLARLDDTEAQAQLGLTRAQLTAARSQLAEVRAQLVQAEQDHARQQGLYDRQLIAPHSTRRWPSATCCGRAWPPPRSRSRWRSSRRRSPRSSSTTR